MSFLGIGNLSIRYDSIAPGTARLPLPAHRLDEFRLAIPRQVALPHCLLPLRQPILILGYGSAGGNFLSANGKQWLNFLCHLRGQPQPVKYMHVVFTIPHQPSWLALQNKKVIYDLLFRASAATLLEIAADLKHLIDVCII
jgi:hypothetical protein